MISLVIGLIMTASSLAEWSMSMNHERRVCDRLNDRCQIVGVSIHVVPGPGLTGSTMTTPVAGDDAKSILGEEEHLAIPRIGTQRPSV